MSTTRTTPLWRVLASVLTGALIASASVLGVAVSANAAELSLDVAEVPRSGGTVTVSGSGYLADELGVYLGVSAEGTATDVSTVWVAVGNAAGTIPGVGATAPMNADGSFAVQVEVPAYTEGTSYVIHTRRAHGQPEPDPSQLARIPLVYEALPPAAPTTTALVAAPESPVVAGSSVTVTATVSPADAAGTVTFRNGTTALGTADLVGGSASLSMTGLPVGTASLTAQFAPTDVAAYVGSSSSAISFEVTTVPTEPEEPVFVPAVEVFLADGVTPYTGQPVYTDDVLVVNGTGFDPASNVGGRGAPIPNTLPQGTYVVLGSFLAAWQPSTGAPAATRATVSTKWALAESVLDQVPANFQATIRAQWAPLSADGAFSTTVTAQNFANGLADGNWGVYTYGAGGVANAAQELSVPVNYLGARPVAEGPSLTVTPNVDLDPNVEQTLTITGTGYTGPGAASGAYVLFGETSVWSGGTPLPAAGWIAQEWVQPAQIVGGAFQTTLTIAAGTLDPAKTYHVATSAAHGLSITDRTLDAFTPVTVGAATPTEPRLFLSSDSVQQGGSLEVRGTGFPGGELVTVVVNSDPVTLGSALVNASGGFTVSGFLPATFDVGSHTVVATAGAVTLSVPLTVTAATVVPAPEQPAQPTCVARAVSSASIEWGVKQSFRDYITGPIAQGTYSGGWGSGSGSYNTEEDRGRVSYGGSMSFNGHSGALDLTISNPRIQVTGTGSASLIVSVQSQGFNGAPSVNASGVVFATLSLPGAIETGSRISWNSAAATLTESGAEAFAGFYTAGTALDPVTFSFPLGADVPCDATTSGSLAATGGEAPVDGLWLGIGMLLLGAGVYALRRQRSSVKG